jgi:hypothetical protein
MQNAGVVVVVVVMAAASSSSHSLFLFFHEVPYNWVKGVKAKQPVYRPTGCSCAQNPLDVTFTSSSSSSSSRIL